MDADAREQHAARILASLAGCSRVLGAARTRPFGDLQLTRTQVDALFLVAHGRRPGHPAISPGRWASPPAPSPSWSTGCAPTTWCPEC